MAEIGIATNKKLLELFNMMKNGSLVLAPSFQRKLVWNDEHKESFIESILLGLPFPEIYLADGEIDLDSQTSKTLVVDGQQRLSTIYQYITSSPDFNIKRIKTFSALEKHEKTNFFDYNVVIRDLGRIEEDRIREIFKRINSVNYALNAIEISNALYEGEFIKSAKNILEFSELLSDISVFSESEFSRMKDLQYLLLMMATVEEGGYFSGDTQVETYIKLYDSEYPNKELTLDYFRNVFRLISLLDLPADSLWNKRSSLFTLVVELVKFRQKHACFPEKLVLKKTLMTLEDDLNTNKREDVNTNEFAQYYYYTHQGTSGRKGRYVRGRLLKRYLEPLAPGPPLLVET